VTPPSDQQPMLQLDHATVKRGNQRVLDDISLALRDGEHTAILGPNGSGKSSLIRLITRQYYPLARSDKQPSVRIYGRDRWNVAELRSLLGIISPDVYPIAIDGATDAPLVGRDVVLSGFFASAALFEHHVVTDAMREHAQATLDLVDALPLAEKPISEMSTGEARRIYIARALVSAPRALLLDEPTAGLDLLAMHRFLATMRRVAQHGTMLVLVTHHIDEIIPEIERVILLRQGRIFRDGPKSGILTTEHLSALYDAPIRVSTAGGYYAATAHEDA